MKRIVAIGLMCMFLLATGTLHAVTLHFCSGDLSSISLTKQGKGCDGCKTKQKGCCKDIVKIVKTDNYQKISFTFDFSGHFIALPADVFYTHLLPAVILCSAHNSSYAHAPPSVHKEPYFILYRSLII